MNINELQLGNLVYMDKITKFPMKVVGLFEDMVYLDFEGNEGDRFEVKAEDVQPIPTTWDLLENNGFELITYNLYNAKYEKRIGEFIFQALGNFSGLDGLKWYLMIGEKNSMKNAICKNIQYLHQLQNAMRMVGIEWKVKL